MTTEQAVSRVQGRTLPISLRGVGEKSAWVAARACAELDPLPLCEPETVTFLDVLGMRAQTEALRSAISSGEGRWVRVSQFPQAMVPGFLSADEVVIIAVGERSDALALDYSVGAEPRVVLTTDLQSVEPSWMEVASSFEELLALIGLSSIASFEVRTSGFRVRRPQAAKERDVRGADDSKR